MTTTISPSAWAQLPKETAHAFALFQAYRDLPPEQRSARAAALKVGNSIKSAEIWCAKFKWVERAKAYDEYKDNLAIREREATIVSVERAVSQNLAYQIGVMNSLVDIHVAEMERRSKEGDIPSVKEIREMIGLLKEKDAVLRNLVGGGAGQPNHDPVYEL